MDSLEGVFEEAGEESVLHFTEGFSAAASLFARRVPLYPIIASLLDELEWFLRGN